MKTLPRLSLLATLIATAAFSSGAFAATATGNASATALTPITIAPATALSFGSFATSAAATAGTIMLTTAGGRTASGGTVLSAGGPGVVGTFTIGGTGSASFAVTYPTGATAFTGTTTGITALFGTAAGAGATYGLGTAALTGGAYTLLVGGILTVPAAVVAGSYTATYPVIVEYN